MPIRVAVIEVRPKGQCVSARMWGERGACAPSGGNVRVAAGASKRDAELPLDPVVPLLGWNRMEARAQQKHMSAQFGHECPRRPFSQRLQGANSPKWPPGGKQINKLWSSHTVEYPSALERTGVLTRAAPRCPMRTSVSCKTGHQSSVSTM